MKFKDLVANSLPRVRGRKNNKKSSNAASSSSSSSHSHISGAATHGSTGGILGGGGGGGVHPEFSTCPRYFPHHSASSAGGLLLNADNSRESSVERSSTVAVVDAPWRENAVYKACNKQPAGTGAGASKPNPTTSTSTTAAPGGVGVLADFSNQHQHHHHQQHPLLAASAPSASAAAATTSTTQQQQQQATQALTYYIPPIANKQYGIGGGMVMSHSADAISSQATMAVMMTSAHGYRHGGGSKIVTTSFSDHYGAGGVGGSVGDFGDEYNNHPHPYHHQQHQHNNSISAISENAVNYIGPNSFYHSQHQHQHHHHHNHNHHYVHHHHHHRPHQNQPPQYYARPMPLTENHNHNQLQHHHQQPQHQHQHQQQHVLSIPHVTEIPPTTTGSEKPKKSGSGGGGGFFRKSFASFRAMRKQGGRTSKDQEALHHPSGAAAIEDKDNKCSVCPYPQPQTNNNAEKKNGADRDRKSSKQSRKGLKSLTTKSSKKQKSSNSNSNTTTSCLLDYHSDKSWYSDNDAQSMMIHPSHAYNLEGGVVVSPTPPPYSSSSVSSSNYHQFPVRECSMEGSIPRHHPHQQQHQHHHPPHHSNDDNNGGLSDSRESSCVREFFDGQQLQCLQDTGSMSGYDSDFAGSTASKTRGTGRSRSRIKTNPWLPSPQPSLTMGRRFENCRLRESAEEMDDDFNASCFPRSVSFDYHCQLGGGGGGSSLLCSSEELATRRGGVQRHRSLTPVDLKLDLSLPRPLRKPVATSSSAVVAYKGKAADEEDYNVAVLPLGKELEGKLLPLLVDKTMTTSSTSSNSSNSRLNDLNTTTTSSSHGNNNNSSGSGKPRSRPNSIVSPNSEFTALADNIEQLANNISFEYEDAMCDTPVDGNCTPTTPTTTTTSATTTECGDQTSEGNSSNSNSNNSSCHHHRKRKPDPTNGFPSSSSDNNNSSNENSMMMMTMMSDNAHSPDSGIGCLGSCDGDESMTMGNSTESSPCGPTTMSMTSYPDALGMGGTHHNNNNNNNNATSLALASAEKIPRSSIITSPHGAKADSSPTNNYNRVEPTTTTKHHKHQQHQAAAIFDACSPPPRHAANTTTSATSSSSSFLLPSSSNESLNSGAISESDIDNTSYKYSSDNTTTTTTNLATNHSTSGETDCCFKPLNNNNNSSNNSSSTYGSLMVEERLDIDFRSLPRKTKLTPSSKKIALASTAPSASSSSSSSWQQKPTTKESRDRTTATSSSSSSTNIVLPMESEAVASEYPTTPLSSKENQKKLKKTKTKTTTKSNDVSMVGELNQKLSAAGGQEGKEQLLAALVVVSEGGVGSNPNPIHCHEKSIGTSMSAEMLVVNLDKRQLLPSLDIMESQETPQHWKQIEEGEEEEEEEEKLKKITVMEMTDCDRIDKDEQTILNPFISTKENHPHHSHQQMTTAVAYAMSETVDACVQTDFLDDIDTWGGKTPAASQIAQLDEHFDPVESTRRWLLSGNMQGSADTGYSSQPRDSHVFMDEEAAALQLDACGSSDFDFFPDTQQQQQQQQQCCADYDVVAASPLLLQLPPPPPITTATATAATTNGNFFDQSSSPVMDLRSRHQLLPSQQQQQQQQAVRKRHVASTGTNLGSDKTKRHSSDSSTSTLTSDVPVYSDLLGNDFGIEPSKSKAEVSVSDDAPQFLMRKTSHHSNHSNSGSHSNNSNNGKNEFPEHDYVNLPVRNINKMMMMKNCHPPPSSSSSPPPLPLEACPTYSTTTTSNSSSTKKNVHNHNHNNINNKSSSSSSSSSSSGNSNKSNNNKEKKQHHNHHHHLQHDSTSSSSSSRTSRHRRPQQQQQQQFTTTTIPTTTTICCPSSASSPSSSSSSSSPHPYILPLDDIQPQNSPTTTATHPHPHHLHVANNTNNNNNNNGNNSNNNDCYNEFNCDFDCACDGGSTSSKQIFNTNLGSFECMESLSQIDQHGADYLEFLRDAPLSNDKERFHKKRRPVFIIPGFGPIELSFEISESCGGVGGSGGFLSPSTSTSCRSKSSKIPKTKRDEKGVVTSTSTGHHPATHTSGSALTTHQVVPEVSDSHSQHHHHQHLGHNDSRNSSSSSSSVSKEVKGQSTTTTSQHVSSGKRKPSHHHHHHHGNKDAKASNSNRCPTMQSYDDVDSSNSAATDVTNDVTKPGNNPHQHPHQHHNHPLNLKYSGSEPPSVPPPPKPLPAPLSTSTSSSTSTTSTTKKDKEKQAKTLAERVSILRREKEVIYRKIQEVQEMELSRQREQLHHHRQLHSQRKEELLETLHDLKEKLEEQSRKLHSSKAACGDEI